MTVNPATVNPSDVYKVRVVPLDIIDLSERVMPITSTSLDSNVSGIVGPAGDSFAFVTYDASYLYASPNGEGALDQIPAFIYLAGDVKYGIDSQGNVVAYNKNADGSSPIK